jgi:uncharacterized membrane-anchored protein YhcB (DUF1043 family)
MRRQTRWILSAAAAAALMAGGWVAVELTAPTGSAQHALQVILQDGKTALAVRSSSPVLRHFAPDAQIFGLNPRQLETLLSRALNEVSTGLQLQCTQVKVTASGARAEASLQMEVSEKMGKDRAVYFQSRLDLRMQIQTSPGPLGIGSIRRWKIVAVKADPPLPVTALEFL